MYTITKNFIDGLPHIPYRHGPGAYEGVVAHSTDTPNATDEAERNFESAHWQTAFVHYFVDWDSITQVADTDFIAYGAGEIANQRYVMVELCETADAKLFQASYARYTWILAKILFDKKLGVTHKGTFWTHADVTATLGGTTHQDPVEYLQKHGVSIDKLVADVTAQYNLMSKPATAPAKPAAPLTKPATSTTAKKKYVSLPANADSWAVYPLGVAPVKANAKGYLNPEKFKGLTYEVLGNPQTDVYTIQTDNFGKVNIYAASSTGAKIVLK